MSPLPFGVHRVHHVGTVPRLRQGHQRLHCLSAFTAFTTKGTTTLRDLGVAVSIAFRRSPRSPQLSDSSNDNPHKLSPLPFGVHRVHHVSSLLIAKTIKVVSIAFRRSPRSPPAPPSATSRP